MNVWLVWSSRRYSSTPSIGLVGIFGSWPKALRSAAVERNSIDNYHGEHYPVKWDDPEPDTLDEWQIRNSANETVRIERGVVE